MSYERIALVMTDEIRELLVDNAIDVENELRQVGLDVKQEFIADPTSLTSNKEREVITVIVAAGVTLSLLASAIAKVIDAIGRNRKVIVEEVRLVPATNERGEVLYDAAGIAHRSWTRTEKLVEASQVTQDRTDLTVEAGLKGIRLSYSSGDSKHVQK